MNILLYKGSFNYNVVNYFVDELSNSLAEKENNVYIVDLTKEIKKQEDKFKLAKFIISEKIDLIISFNGINTLSPEFYKQYNIIFGTIFVDHPFYHFDRINMYNYENCFVGILDEGTIKTLKNYIQNNINAKHIMHGGSYSTTGNQNIEYDVVVAGGLDHLEKFEEFIKGKLDDNSTIIANYIYNNAIDNYKITLDDYLNEIIEFNNLNGIISQKYELKQLVARIYSIVDSYIRKEIRYKSVVALLENGIEVNYFGDCNCDELDIYPNFINHGRVEYIDMLEIMKHSKIVIHTIGYFYNGSHERVFSAMLNKALVISNINNYSNNIYKDKENIVMFDVNKEHDLVDKVKYYLNNEIERNRIIENAFEITTKYNTWDNRADEILQIYNEIKINL